jgi:hypothetical protein
MTNFRFAIALQIGEFSRLTNAAVGGDEFLTKDAISAKGSWLTLPLTRSPST